MAPLRAVVYRFGFLDLPWTAVLAAARDGRLPIGLRDQNSAGSLVDGLLVADDDATRRLLLSFRLEGAEDAPSVLSILETKRFLGASINDVVRLAATGYLTRRGDKKWHRHLTRESVEAFRKRYMLTGEIAKRVGCGCRAVRVRMQDLGVAPICTLNDNRLAVWNRQEVAGVLPSTSSRDVADFQNGSGPAP